MKDPTNGIRPVFLRAWQQMREKWRAPHLHHRRPRARFQCFGAPLASFGPRD